MTTAIIVNNFTPIALPQFVPLNLNVDNIGIRGDNYRNIYSRSDATHWIVIHKWTGEEHLQRKQTQHTATNKAKLLVNIEWTAQVLGVTKATWNQEDLCYLLKQAIELIDEP